MKILEFLDRHPEILKAIMKGVRSWGYVLGRFAFYGVCFFAFSNEFDVDELRYWFLFSGADAGSHAFQSRGKRRA